MKYRVAFKVFRGSYYTEWFDTLREAEFFVRDAFNSGGAVDARWIENEDGEVY